MPQPPAATCRKPGTARNLRTLTLTDFRADALRSVDAVFKAM